MIKITISALDYDTGVIETVSLPMSNASLLSPDHEYVIIECSCEFPLGEDDVFKLDSKIQQINTEIPQMSIGLLEEMWKQTEEDHIFSDEVVEKITSKNFMLDEISIPSEFEKLFADEYCAKYLLFTHKIPFALNIDENEIKLMSDVPSGVDWSMVWAYYDLMGFRQVTFEDHVFVLHWGDEQTPSK